MGNKAKALAALMSAALLTMAFLPVMQAQVDEGWDQFNDADLSEGFGEFGLETTEGIGALRDFRIDLQLVLRLWILRIAMGFGTIALTLLEGRTILGIGIEGMEWSIDFLPNIFLLSPIINAILYWLFPMVLIEELSVELAKWGLGVSVNIEMIKFGFLLSTLFSLPYDFFSLLESIIGLLGPGIIWKILPFGPILGYLIGEEGEDFTIGYSIIPWVPMILLRPLSLIPSLFGFWRNLVFDAYIGLPLEENHLYFGVDPLILSSLVCLILSIISMNLGFIQLGLLLAALAAFAASWVYYPFLAVAVALLLVKTLIGFVKTFIMIINIVISLISILIDIHITLWFNIDAERLAFGADPYIAHILGTFNPIPALGIDIEWPW